MAVTPAQNRRNLSRYRLNGLSEHKVVQDGASSVQLKAGISGGSRLATPSITFNGEASLETQVSVQCSCEFFAYTLETANQARQASTQSRSNGQYPVKRNPSLRPGLCPHLLCLAMVWVKKHQVDDLVAKTK